MPRRRLDDDRWWRGQGEAAAMLGVSPPTFRQMISDGEIVLVKLGRRRVVRLADIEAIIAGQKAS